MKVKDLFPEVASELKLGNFYNGKEVGQAINSKKIVKRTVTIRNGVTGEIVGQRSTMTK